RRRGDVQAPGRGPAAAAQDRRGEGRARPEGGGVAHLPVRAAAGQGNTLKVAELTQPNSSMANSLAELIINRLRADDEIADGVGAHRLVRYWPPALATWSTKAARDAFYSSPALPRLLDPNVLKRTIADGVA